MEAYKEKVYKLWAQKNAANYQEPDADFLKARMKAAQETIIAPFFPGNKQAAILDLGCGWGTFLKACMESGYPHVSGVDSVPQAVEFAKSKLGIRQVGVGEIQAYLHQLADQSQDVITAFDVMEHFEKSEIMDMLALIYSKLKKGGKFIMQVPNAGSLSGLYIFYSDITHTMPWTDMLIGELFELTGFGDVKILGIEQQKRWWVAWLKSLRTKLTLTMGRNPFIHFTNLVAVAEK